MPLLAPISPRVILPLTSRKAVATRGQTLGERGKTATTVTRHESRISTTFCKGGARGVRLVYANWGVGASRTAEYDGDNSITVTAAVETTFGSPAAAIPVTWGGSLSVVIPPGATLESDDIPGYFLGDTAYWVRTGVTVTLGQTLPLGSIGYISGESAWDSTSASTQVYSVGAMTQPGGGASQTGFFHPVAIIGFPAQNFMRSVAIIGASQEEGTGESSSPQARGYVARGLFSVNGHIVPNYKLCRGGDGARGLSNSFVTFGRRRLALLRYATDALVSEGYNDITASDTIGNIQTYLTDVYNACAAMGVRAHGMLLDVHTTSTDAWATTVNQTATAGFTAGGTRDLLNAWIKTQVGGLLTSYCDSTAADTDVTGYLFQAGATTDGSHPISTYHAARAVYVNAWALAQGLAS